MACCKQCGGTDLKPNGNGSDSYLCWVCYWDAGTFLNRYFKDAPQDSKSFYTPPVKRHISTY